MSVHEVEELGGVLPLYVQLAERAHVDDADTLPDGFRFQLRVAVAVRTVPPASLRHAGIRLKVSVVNGRSLEGHVHRSGQFAKRERLDRWARGRRSDIRERRVRLLGQNLSETFVAHLPLARAHRDRAVPLEHLDISEPFVHGLYHVLGQHVLAVADELARSRREIDRGWCDEYLAAVCGYSSP